MTDQNRPTIDRELREQEAAEHGLTRFFAALTPPAGAKERLLAKLENRFHESQLTLDDSGPYSFEEAAALAQVDEATSDLLAAGLEEQIIEAELDDEDE
ncbi:MAG: hypothetical protein ACPGYV_07320 [Phycisphaeraceae bacterium]